MMSYNNITGRKNTIYIARRRRKLRRIVFDYEPSRGELFDVMMSHYIILLLLLLLLLLS